MNRKIAMLDPMTEFLSHPAVLPALLGFLGGVFLTFFTLSLRLSALGTAAIQQEKADAKTIADLKTEESALQNEVSSLRTSESRLIKRQGELEAIAGTEEQRREALSQQLSQTDASLQNGLIRLEKTLLNALRQSQPKEEITDFVPHLPAQKETPREYNFEGFVAEPPAAKAESAANVLRAALNDPEA